MCAAGHCAGSNQFGLLCKERGARKFFWLQMTHSVCASALPQDLKNVFDAADIDHSTKIGV